MAIATPCQTPGAQFTTHISSAGVMVGVELPIDNQLDLTPEQAQVLEAHLHNAVEQVLAPYFKK